MESCERKWFQDLLFTATLVLCLRISDATPHLSAFTSHVSFNTPTSSFTHGVGDPRHGGVSRNLYRNYRLKLPQRYGTYRTLQYDIGTPITSSASVYREDATFQGYPSEKPIIPFPTYPSITYGKPLSYPHISGFNDNNIGHITSYTIPVLPASPYRVNSANAESLWPEGLFVPPSIPVHFNTGGKTNLHFHNNDYDDDENIVDPYLLEGFEAVQALDRIVAHGELFYHEIPHVRSLLANQKLRVKNGLHPNRLGSIRLTSPWKRI